MARTTAANAAYPSVGHIPLRRELGDATGMGAERLIIDKVRIASASRDGTAFFAIEPLAAKNANQVAIQCDAEIGTLHADQMRLRNKLRSRATTRGCRRGMRRAGAGSGRTCWRRLRPRLDGALVLLLRWGHLPGFSIGVPAARLSGAFTPRMHQWLQTPRKGLSLPVSSQKIPEISPLFKCDSATLAFYGLKDGKITVNFFGWEQNRVVLEGAKPLR